MNPIYSSEGTSIYQGAPPVGTSQYNYAFPQQTAPVPNTIPTTGVPLQAAPSMQGIPVQQVPAQPMEYQSSQVPLAGIPTANLAPPMQPPGPTIDLLMSFPAVVVSEDLISVAALTSNFNEKKFDVYLTNENGDVTPNQSPFLYASESTDCCSCTSTQNFSTDIKFVDGTELYHLETSSTCGFCAIEKHMTINLSSGDSLGSVRSDEGCMSYTFHVNDESDRECAWVSGSKCQCGLMAFSACNGCNRVEFEVQDCANGSTGSIAKVFAQLGFMNADCLIVVFPPGSQLMDRVRILCAAFLVNSICNSNMNNQHQNGYDTSSGLATGLGLGLMAGHLSSGGHDGYDHSYCEGGSGGNGGDDVDFGGFDGGGGCDADFGGFDGGGGCDADFGGFDD